MANNVFGTGTTPAKFVKTLQQNTSSSTQDTAVQTSTQATTTDKTKNATQLINNNQTMTTTTTNTSNNTNNNNNYSNNNNYNYSSSRSTRSNTSSTSTTTTTSTQTTETTKVDETATQEYTEKVVKEIESESASIFKRNNEILESIYGNKPTTEQVLEQVDVSSSTVSKPTSVLQTFKPQTTVTDNKPEELAQAPESVPTVEDKTSENIVQQQPEIKPDPVVEPINNEPVVVSPQPEQNQNVVENITNTGEQIITNEQPVISAPSETPVVNPTPEETVATEPLNPREAETVQRPNEPIIVEEKTVTKEEAVEEKVPNPVEEKPEEYSTRQPIIYNKNDDGEYEEYDAEEMYERNKPDIEDESVVSSSTEVDNTSSITKEPVVEEPKKTNNIATAAITIGAIAGVGAASYATYKAVKKKENE